MEEEYPIGYQLKQVSERCRHRFDRQLESMGLTFSQFALIHFLAHNQEGRVTKKDIGDALELKHSTIIGILNRLEKKGLVRFGTDEKDARCRNVYLTEAALAKLEELEENHRRMDQRFMNALSQEETAELKRLLKKVLAALSAG